MMIKKNWCKIAVWFSYISILSSNIPLGFHDWIQVMPQKCLMYFLSGINTTLNNFEIFLKKKIFCSIKNTKFIYEFFC